MIPTILLISNTLHLLRYPKVKAKRFLGVLLHPHYYHHLN
jgi:hypothetical protein